MPDEGTPPVEGQAPVETPPVETVPVSLISADGSLMDDWQKHAPEGYEDLRDDKTLSSFKRIWDIGKSYSHVRKQVPVDKMPRPNDNWGDQEWDAYYTAAGKLATPEDYQIPDAPEGWDERLIPWTQVKSDWQNTFHALGLNKKQTDAIIALNAKHNESIQKSVDDMAQEQAERNADTLRDEWGRAFDQKSFRAEKAVERGVNGDEGLREHIANLMDSDVNLKRWMANIEDKFSEHEPIEKVNIPTPADLQQQIDDLEADPRYTSSDMKVRKPLFEKVFRLREQMAREKQPV